MTEGKNLLPDKEEEQSTIKVDEWIEPVNQPKSIILSEKVWKKAGLHYAVEVGGTIPLNKGLFGIRIIPKENGWVAIQIISSGISNPVKYSLLNVNRAKSKPKKKGGKKIEFKSAKGNLF